LAVAIKYQNVLPQLLSTGKVVAYRVCKGPEQRQELISKIESAGRTNIHLLDAAKDGAADPSDQGARNTVDTAGKWILFV
jgi:hypothetical protein